MYAGLKKCFECSLVLKFVVEGVPAKQLNINRQLFKDAICLFLSKGNSKRFWETINFVKIHNDANSRGWG